MEFFNHLHCKYTGVKGFVRLYEDALRYRYMITQKALHRARVLAFWEKHGLEATMEAFGVKRRTLFLWKQKQIEGGGKLESLNDKSRAPRTKRKRLWPAEVIAEIKRQRWEHPNLGKEKIYPLLKAFCDAKSLVCPKEKTIGRLIHDLGGLRIFPQKITHFGKIKPIKRRKKLRKPKDFKVAYPGHLAAFDTVERHIHDCRRYVITFEDIYTRFGFAWATTSHASKAAKEFFDYCRMVFPFPFVFILTDNGSEFAKHFAEELKRLHLVHYHTHPKTPKQNPHLERFNRTIQEEFIDYHASELLNVQLFNRKLIDWLIWYNTERVHHAFQNKLSPVQFIMTLQLAKLPQECKSGWPHTSPCLLLRKMYNKQNEKLG
jgi:transposase InsO family protein